MEFLALKTQEKQSQIKPNESKSKGVTNHFFKYKEETREKDISERTEFKKKSKNYFFFFLNQTK